MSILNRGVGSCQIAHPSNQILNIEDTMIVNPVNSITSNVKKKKEKINVSNIYDNTFINGGGSENNKNRFDSNEISEEDEMEEQINRVARINIRDEIEKKNDIYEEYKDYFQ
jgi:hypothetical protein